MLHDTVTSVPCSEDVEDNDPFPGLVKSRQSEISKHGMVGDTGFTIMMYVEVSKRTVMPQLCFQSPVS